jgi:hypothetical protein
MVNELAADLFSDDMNMNCSLIPQLISFSYVPYYAM